MGIYVYCQQITADQLSMLLTYKTSEEIDQFIEERQRDEPHKHHCFDRIEDIELLDNFMSRNEPEPPWTISEGGHPIEGWLRGFGPLRYLTRDDLLAAQPSYERMTECQCWRRWCELSDMDVTREPCTADFLPFTGDEVFESREALLTERRRRGLIEDYRTTSMLLADFRELLRSAADAGDVLLLWIG